MINLVCALLKKLYSVKNKWKSFDWKFSEYFYEGEFFILIKVYKLLHDWQWDFLNKTWRNFYSEVWNFYEREFWILNHLTLGFEHLRFYLFSHCSARKHWSFPFKDLIYYLSNGTEFNTRLFSHWSSFLAEVSMSGRGGQLQN